MSFESISWNWLSQQINNHLAIGYILKLLCLYGVSHKVITPLDLLCLPIELRTVSELDGNSIIAQHVNRIMNSKKLIRILKETSKSHCPLRSNAIGNILLPYN